MKSDLTIIKVNLAELHKDIEYLIKAHGDNKKDICEIKEILINGSNKIAENRQDIKNLKWIVGIVLIAIVGLLFKIII